MWYPRLAKISMAVITDFLVNLFVLRGGQSLMERLSGRETPLEIRKEDNVRGNPGGVAGGRREC